MTVLLLPGNPIGMLHLVRTCIGDLLDLLYPRLCAACGCQHPPEGSALCIACQIDLPRTDYHLFRENPLTRRFTGRFALETATSMFYYVKDTPVQDMLHRIKYQGRKEAAWSLGQHYGRELRTSGLYETIDMVVPVPLHPHREHQRGYNQSAWWGRGLSEGLGVESNERGLVRVRKTESQTNKSRQDRLLNTREAFVVRKPSRLKGRHILLVDDVMTTGATLEACALPLLTLPGVRISIATLAVAQD